MAYTTAADVTKLTPILGTLSGTSKVTSFQLASMLAEVEAEIDVALSSLGYAVPWDTAGPYLTWLGKLASEGAAATLLKAWFSDSSGPNSEASWAVFERRYRDGLAAIRARTMLPTTAGEGSGALPGGLTLTQNPARATTTRGF